MRPRWLLYALVVGIGLVFLFVAGTSVGPALAKPEFGGNCASCHSNGIPSSSRAANRVAEFTIGSMRYTVNGQPFFMDVAPYIHNGRTYLPVRYVAYALGVPEGGISYTNGVVSLVKDGRTVQMTIGSRFLVVNGVTTVMDVAPVTKNGRTMLPLRWIATALGASVNWDEATKTVTVALATAEPSGQTGTASVTGPQAAITSVTTAPISQTSGSQISSQTQVPQPPSGLYLAGISSGSANGSYQITLQWNSVTGATSYRVYARASYWDRFYYLAETATTNYTTTANMNANDYWQFYVTAVNSPGESSPSNTIMVTPPKPPSLEITDDFSRDTGLWQYYGSAYRDPKNQYAELTSAKTWQVGILWLRQETAAPFVAEFKYWAGGGTGADGLTFMFYKDKNYQPSAGNDLGFYGSPGYAIAFDSYPERYITLISNSGVLESVKDARVADGKWHQVRVEVYDRVVIVYLDGGQVLKWGGTINRKYGGLGFSAATGAKTNYHLIDDVKITPLEVK